MKNRFDSATCFWSVTLLIAALCVSFPAFSTGHVIAGGDMPFHLGRIEGIAAALQAGQFPARLNPVQAGGYGMPTGIFYPDVFLYIPAVLRLMGMPLLICWKFTFLVTHILTAFLSWWAFSVATQSRQTGAMAALFYEVAFYRLVMGYSTMDIGALLAMAFLPVAIVAVWVTLRRDTAYWPMAVVGSTGVLLSHILSSIFLLGTVFLMLVLSFRRLARPEVRSAAGRATGFIFLLTIWFYAPLLYFHQHMEYAIRISMKDVWAGMVYPFQACDFYVGSGMLAFVMVLAVIQFFRHRGTPGLFWYLLVSALAMAFLISFLPLWQKLGSWVGWLQFPGRLTVFPAIMISVAAAIGIEQIGLAVRWQRAVAILGALFVFAENVLWQAGLSYCMPPWTPGYPPLFENRMTMTAYWSSIDLGVEGGTTDYMDAVAYRHLMDSWPEFPGMRDKLLRKEQDRAIVPDDRILNIERMGTTFKMHCMAGEEEWLHLPIFWYMGYAAETENGERLPLQRGEDGQVDVRLLPSEEDVSVRVWYEGLPWFHATDLISWFSLFGFLYAVACRRKKTYDEV